MAARPLTLTKKRRIVITHTTTIEYLGGKSVHITHNRPKISLVKVESDDHNAAESAAMTPKG